MLENWRIREKLNDTVDRLEDLYKRDMLTGLYNRRGYEAHFKRLFRECVIEERSIAVMVIDMDDLKYVNDNYGHTEGDYSLTTIADGMKAAATQGEVCLRTGGDEFAVLAKGYTYEMAEDYIRRLREYMEKRVQQDKKEYPLGVSVGVCVRNPEDNDGIITDAEIDAASEEYMKYADAEMYKEKKAHKQG
jgi:diguanylate cyclase (GGDEF) domain